MLRRGIRKNGVRRGRGRGRRALGNGVRRTHPASNPTLQFARSGAFVPSRTRVSLRFSTFEGIALSGSYLQRAVSGNSAFDPGAALSTAQPVGFDYWSSMYDRYRVIGSQIQLKLCLGGTSAGNSSATTTVTCWPGTQSGTLSSLADAEAQPYAKTVNVTTDVPKIITSVMKTSTVTGIKDLEGADQLQALISANPVNEWYWNIGFASQATYIDMHLALEYIITYDVEFFDRAMINRSSLVWKHIKSAYLERCAEHREQAREHKMRQQKAELKQVEQLAHLKQLDAGLQEIEDYKKREKYVLSLTETDEEKSAVSGVHANRGDPPLSNISVHEKWLKLREADALARVPPNTPAKSKATSLK